MKLHSPPLFWRTFLLIVCLAIASLLAWVPSVRILEREPRAHQLAARIVSLTNATRIALVYSDPARRSDLLTELHAIEGLHVVPREPGDVVIALPDTPFLRLVESEVRQRLGPNTQMAQQVNDIDGFWVSFSIEGDAYWVFIDRDMLRRDLGHGWIAWALLATAFSLLVAIAIARVVNRPLAELSRAAGDLGAGRVPAPLPDAGPIEIRTVNQSFNRMVSDLEKLEQDRAILLAGVSHDLRTPLTRMRLELEMSDLPEESRNAMIADLEQMDQVIHQFLDYAMPVPQRSPEDVDLSLLVREALVRNRPFLAATRQGAAAANAPPDCVQEDIADDIHVPGYRTELARTLDNLIANAQRYGRNADGQLDLSVSLRREAEAAVLVMSDHGAGIDATEISRLVRPFERGEPSRSAGWGAGLGLAIVERVMRLHGARITYERNEPRGLRVQIRLPLQKPENRQGAAAPA